MKLPVSSGCQGPSEPHCSFGRISVPPPGTCPGARAAWPLAGPIPAPARKRRAGGLSQPSRPYSSAAHRTAPFGNVAVHEYFGIHRPIVWVTAAEQAPTLREQIQVVVHAEFPEQSAS